MAKYLIIVDVDVCVGVWRRRRRSSKTDSGEGLRGHGRFVEEGGGGLGILRAALFVQGLTARAAGLVQLVCIERMNEMLGAGVLLSCEWQFEQRYRSI